MQDEIKNISDKNIQYIPLSEAGQILNTSRDYMNVLVRRGKLRAIKLGRNWVTTSEWLNEYKNPSDLNIGVKDLEKAEKEEFRNLKSGLILEREKSLEAGALIPEIKLSSRELQREERKNILELVQSRFKKIDALEFEKASRRWGILKSLRQGPSLKLAAVSLAIVLLITTIGFAGLNILKFKNLNISKFQDLKASELQANILSDVFKNFPSDIPIFYRWFTLSLSKGFAFLKSKTPSELATGELLGGKSKIIKPQEAPSRIDTLDEALALDAGLVEELPQLADGSTPLTTGGEFTLIENRLSVVEANLAEQNVLTGAELSLQKKTILGTLETLIGISKLLPTHPISTIVVQGQPATLTTYSVQPSVHSGFDRLSASYLTLSNNAEINGSLTVKSGGTFNSLSVSGATTLTGNTTIGGALRVAGDSTLGNVTVNGTLNIPGKTSLGNASTTYLTVSNTGWINQFKVTGTATTTFNGPITSASGNFIIAGDSANNVLLNPYGGNVGIGTTSPGSLLSVHSTGNVYFGGALAVSGASTFQNTASFSGAVTLSNTLTQTASSTSSVISSVASSTADHFSFDARGAGAIFNILKNSSSKFYVNSGGNIGIASTTLNSNQALTVQGNAFFYGGLGVGVATTTTGAIQTSGDVFVGRNLRVAGNSTVIGGSSSDTLVVNSSVGSNLIPTSNNFYNLGSPSFYWGNLYIDTVNANNISGASTTISGTKSNDFTINTDNVSVDQENMNLIFFRGVVPPNAVISWNAATSSKYFKFNQATRFFNESASTTNPTLTVQGVTNQTANVFQALDVATSTVLFSVNPVSQKTTMINASTTNLTVSGNLWAGSSGAFMLADGTVSNPALAFAADTDTGLFRIGDGKMSFATNATTSLTLDTGKVIVGNDLFTATYQLEVADRDANNNTIVDELRLSHFTTGTAGNGLGAGLLFYGQDSTGAGQNLARVAAQVEEANPATGFLSRLIFSTVSFPGSLLEKMRLTGNGQLLLGTTTTPFSYGVNIATSTNIFGKLTVGTSSLDLLSGNIISNSGQFNITNAANTALTFSTNNSERMRIDNGGNVGIGTTSPGFLLSVAGQCVTGDTKLRRRKKRRGKNGEIEYEYDEIEIKNIKSGDEILSLNEKTGKLVWSRVNALMDMGVKPIYKLTTASGKTIRTTGNHPYLTKYGWVPVGDLREGDEIACPVVEFGTRPRSIDFVAPTDSFHRNDFVFDRKFNPPVFANAIAVRCFLIIGKMFGKLQRIWRRGVEIQFVKNTPANIGRTFFEKIFRLRRIDNFHEDYLMPYLFLNSSMVTNFPASISAVARLSDSRKAGLNVSMSSTVVSSSSLSAFDNFQSTISAREISDSSFRSSQSGSSGLFNPLRKALGFQTIFNSLSREVKSASSFVSNTAFGSRERITSGKDMSGFDKIWLFICRQYTKAIKRLSNYGGDIKWDKIVSIECAGIERVWDISVKNTHNFVANNIIAHNTYLSATTTISNDLVVDTNTLFVDSANNRVGIGTAGPGSLLQMHATAGTDSILRLSDADVAHGMTVQYPTNVFGVIGNNSATGGGLAVQGLNNAGTFNAVFVRGMLGNNDPTDTVAAVQIDGTKKDVAGTSITALGSAETILGISNNQGTNLFVVTGGGNVGIGTTSPQLKLHVSAVSADPQFVLERTGTAVGKWSIGVNDAGIVFRDDVGVSAGAGPTRLFINPSGNVGIGTASPGNLLTLYGADKSLELVNSIASNKSWRLESNGSDLAVVETGVANQVTFKAGGNVGIGTTSPSSSLHVVKAGDPNPIFVNTNIADGSGVTIDFFTWAAANDSRARARISSTKVAGGDHGDLKFTVRNAGVFTEALYIKQDGNVGIGTTSPGQRLVVRGATAEAIIRLERANDPLAAGAIDFAGNDGIMDWQVGVNRLVGNAFEVNEASTNRFVILTGGNVGIGTTSPSSSLHVVKAGDPNPIFVNTNIADGSGVTIDFFTWAAANDSRARARISSTKVAGGDHGDLKFTVRNAGVFTEALYIKQDGNVGIGTTSPAGTLDVRGGTASSGAGVPIVLSAQTGAASSDGGRILLNAGPNGAGGNDGYIAFGTGSSFTGSGNTLALATERMRIDSAGNVGIGTTSPARKLEINGGVGDGIRVSNSQANIEVVGMDGSTVYNVVLVGGSAGSDTLTIGRRASGTGIITDLTLRAGANVDVMTLKSSGNVGIGTTSPTQLLTISKAGTAANANIPNGALCIDNDGGCTPGAAGNITFVTSTTGNSDVAENYYSSTPLETGDIVMTIGGNNIDKASTTSMAVIGVVSISPGMTLGYDEKANASSTYPVALVGRVPVKVSTEAGAISIGDRISMSSIAGVGIKAVASAITVGTALEPYNNEGVGKILVFVNLGYYTKLDAKQGSIDLISLNNDLNLNGFSLLNVKSISGLNGLWSIDADGNITAQSVQTQSLTVGGGAASGVTVYDRATAAPKCIYIEGGVIKTSDGACGMTVNSGTPAEIIPASSPVVLATAPTSTSTPLISETIPSPAATSSVSEINTATTTPVIVEPILTTAATTPIIDTITASTTEPTLTSTSTTP